MKMTWNRDDTQRSDVSLRCQDGLAKSLDDLCDEYGIEGDVVVTLHKLAAENLEGYIGELENDILYDLNKMLQSVEEEESSMDDNLESMATAVEKQCSDIKAVVDKAKKEMFGDLFADKKKRSKMVKEMREDLLLQKNKFEQLLDDCKRHLEIGGEEMQTFFNEQCPSIHSFTFHRNFVQSCFSRGVIDVPELRKEIGELDLGTKKTAPPLKATLVRYPCIGMAGKDPEVLSNFDTNIIIGDIRISNSGEVWMTNEESHHITKYNRDGTIDRYLNTTAYNENFIIDKNGNLLACDYWDDRITKITPHGRVSPLIKNLPSAPTGICINHEGDIVVCMINHHWMAVYTSDGQIKKREMSIRRAMLQEIITQKGWRKAWRRLWMQVGLPSRKSIPSCSEFSKRLYCCRRCVALQDYLSGCTWKFPMEIFHRAIHTRGKFSIQYRLHQKWRHHHCRYRVPVVPCHQQRWPIY